MLILVAVTIDIAIDGKLFDTAKEAVDRTNEKVAITQDIVDDLLGKFDNMLDEDNAEDPQLSMQLNIQSNLVTYNESLGEFPIVYSIIGKKGEEIIYEDIVLVTISKSGSTDNNIRIDNIPSDVTLTIEPIYYGPNYNLVGDTTKTIEITKNNTQMQTIGLEYEYNGKIIGSKGIS